MKNKNNYWSRIYIKNVDININNKLRNECIVSMKMKVILNNARKNCIG